MDIQPFERLKTLAIENKLNPNMEDLLGRISLILNGLQEIRSNIHTDYKVKLPNNKGLNAFTNLFTHSHILEILTGLMFNIQSLQESLENSQANPVLITELDGVISLLEDIIATRILDDSAPVDNTEKVIAFNGQSANRVATATTLTRDPKIIAFNPMAIEG